MNKKIKIIQILDNYADDKEIIMPKYIRYWDRIGHKDEIMLVCKANIINKLDDCKIDLNDEVEILEDNTEELEEYKGESLEQLGYEIGKMSTAIVKGLIKAVNEMKEESEDKQ